MKIEDTFYYQNKKLHLEVNKLGRSIKKEYAPFFIMLNTRFPWLIYVLTAIIYLYVIAVGYMTVTH